MKFKYIDFGWIFLLFGTSFGAGILFLPLQAAESGFVSLLITSSIIFPIMYFGQKNIMKIVFEGKKNSDITQTIHNNLGKTFSLICTIIYFIGCFSVIMAYGICLPHVVANTLAIYKIVPFGFHRTPIYDFIVLFIPVVIAVAGRKIILALVPILVYFLIAVFIIISIYLLPHCHLQPYLFSNITFHSVLSGTLVMFPILVFALNFSQSVSPMTLYYKQNTDASDMARVKARRVLFSASVAITCFTFLFVYVCMLSLPIDKMKYGAMHNLSALSVVTGVFKTGFIHYVGPIIASVAILCPLLSCLLGTLESANGLILQAIELLRLKIRFINEKTIKFVSVTVIFLLLWILAISDINILSILGLISAPSIAIFVFIMPGVVKLFLTRRLDFRKDFSFIIMFFVGALVLVSHFLSSL